MEIKKCKKHHGVILPQRMWCRIALNSFFRGEGLLSWQESKTDTPMRRPKNLTTKLAVSALLVACMIIVVVAIVRLCRTAEPVSIIVDERNDNGQEHLQMQPSPMQRSMLADDRCIRSVLHRSLRVDGPAEILAVSGDSPQYERINVAFFDAGKGRHCARHDVPTFSRPSSAFVEHAYSVCHSLSAHGAEQPPKLAITEANDFLQGRTSISSTVVAHDGGRDPARRHLLCYLYFASNYSGHPFELAMDGVGALLGTLQRSHWDSVTVMHHNYAESGHLFAADYLRLLKAAVEARRLNLRFAEISLVDPVRILLRANASLTYVSPMFGATPCQAVAQGLWSALLPTLPFRDVNTCTKCAILKTNSALRHSTPLFFSVEGDTIARNHVGGFHVVREDVAKERRMWLLHTAKILVDSFGANAEIDRLLLEPIVNPSLKSVCWITLVHPLASEEQLSLCERGWFHEIGYVRRYLCPSQQRLGASFFENMTVLCDHAEHLVSARG